MAGLGLGLGILVSALTTKYRDLQFLVAFGVNQDGYREFLGVAEGAKEDKKSWSLFLRHLKERGLTGVRIFTSDKCMGLVESLGEFYPKAQWQRCVVHYYRNVFTAVPKGKVKDVAAMLKAVHAQENREEALAKAESVALKLEEMKLAKAAGMVREGMHETLTYYHFPREHWIRIRTNNPLERIMREIRRRTRVVGAFPDGNSALMLVAARLRHIAGTRWGIKTLSQDGTVSRNRTNLRRLTVRSNQIETPENQMCEKLWTLPKDLDEFLGLYNTRRPHQGRNMKGRVPYKAFIEGLPKEPKGNPAVEENAA